MRRTAVLLLWAWCASAADDKPAVYKADVAMVRVDTQVLDRDNRPVKGLRVEDFVLREEGRALEIRGFAREEMPMDVLLLLDVSTSMRPHIQRISSAAHSALAVLGKDDRIAIMVFDVNTRVRMALRGDPTGAERELDRVIKDERFNGGTDITRAMFDAARYLDRDGRKQARRAIVIVTDDETQFQSDEEGVERTLARDEIVMSALIAPDAMRNAGYNGGQRGPRPSSYPDCRMDPNDPDCRYCRDYPNDPNCRNTYPNGRQRAPVGIGLPGGVGWPGSGGGRYPGGGGGNRGPYPTSGPNSRVATHSAGTSEIARASGGDSLRVEDTYGFETALTRLRQRYALYFYLPSSARAGQSREIAVDLSEAAARRFPDATLRYRRSYIPPEGLAPPADPSEPRTLSKAADQQSADTVAPRRRRIMSGEGGASGPLTIQTGEDNTTPAAPTQAAPAPRANTQDSTTKPPTWRRADDPSTESNGPKSTEPGDNSGRGGWRKVKSTDPPQP